MNEKILEDDRLFTLSEAQEYLRASRSTILRLVASGEIQAYKVRSTLRFYERDLKRAIKPVNMSVSVDDARNPVELLDIESS